MRFRLLTALVAIPLVASACSSGTPDELAGETEDDAALDGKADTAAADGAYTYFEIWRDFRKCVFPLCGGFYLHRLNRTTTTCANGTSSSSCYAPELDFSQSDLLPEHEAALFEGAERDAMSYGAIALVRGRFASKSYTGFGNLGRFIVTEAWLAENDSVSEGVFVKARDNGIRCIQAPCPTITEKALNTSRSANIAELDWSAGGFDDDQISKFWTEMTEPSGVIVAGDRYTFKTNNVWAKGRTATAVYRRIKPAAAAPCYVGGCSGQICSDQEGAISTCEWRDEYACYQTATCERQAGGECGWTETPELMACLGN
jgi:hypothetical protein